MDEGRRLERSLASANIHLKKEKLQEEEEEEEEEEGEDEDPEIEEKRQEIVDMIKGRINGFKLMKKEKDEVSNEGDEEISKTEEQEDEEVEEKEESQMWFVLSSFVEEMLQKVNMSEDLSDIPSDLKMRLSGLVDEMKMGGWREMFPKEEVKEEEEEKEESDQPDIGKEKEEELPIEEQENIIYQLEDSPLGPRQLTYIQNTLTPHLLPLLSSLQSSSSVGDGGFKSYEEMVSEVVEGLRRMGQEEEERCRADMRSKFDDLVALLSDGEEEDGEIEL